MSQEVSEHNVQSDPSNESLKVTLLADGWTSSAGDLSTLNRELAIHLSKHPKVDVSFLVPSGHCTEDDKNEAQDFGVKVLSAKKHPGWTPLDWLSAPPRGHKMDVVIGHGVKLGRQVPFIKDSDQYQNCKWIQVVHTDPEDLSKYKDYPDPISKGEDKHEIQVALCKLADLVVPVGPRLEERYSSYLKQSKRDIFPLNPGLFAREFGDLEQSPNENAEFIVLLCGHGDEEDFELKGYSIAATAFTDHRLQRKPYLLLFVGSPEGKQEEMRQRLLHCGIAKDQLTVRKFVQSRQAMKDLLCEVNLVIMPSRSKAFGLVALEALSAGLPILVNSKSGFARALEELHYGDLFIVNSDKPAKWAEAIEGVRVRHGKRLEEIKLLRISYDKQYSWKEQSQSFVEKLWTMVHGSSTGSVKTPPANPPVQGQSAVAAPDRVLSGQQPSSDQEREGSGTNVEREPSGLQFLRKDRKRKTSGSTFDLDRVIVLKISAPDLYDEAKEELYTILLHEGEQDVKRRKLLEGVLEEGVGFFNYLRKIKVDLTCVAKNSLEIVMLCPTLESLEKLWNYHVCGHLSKVAERLLVTDEIKRKLNLETVRLTTTIGKENYLMCKKALMEMTGAAHSTHLPSEETKPDQGEDARGTGTSSDDQKGNNTSWMSRGEKAKASRSVLHRASVNGQYEAVKILLERGADVDKRDEFYLTPLHLACWHGQESVARLLLEHGADANALDRFHRTPLQKAERNNHQSIAQLLLENNASPSYRQPLTLKTLARKAFLRVDGLSGFNLLQVAVLEGDYDTVSKASVLLDDFVKGMETVKTIFEANVSTGKSAADILSRFERRGRNRAKIDKLHREIVEIEQSLKELHHHAKTDDPEKVVELVLNDGVDVNIPAENNLTPLMCASQSSSCELFKSLIDLGADINSYKTDDGVTPFLLAASWNHYVAIHLLLEHDADANLQDCAKARRALLQSVSKNRGNTALHKSALGGFFNISRLLIKSGCNINQHNAHGETPLHMAVKTNSEAVVKLLLENNVHVNIQDCKGSTALHTSVRGGFFNISQLLIESGCNINKQNSLDETPLHTAVKTNSEPVVKMLLENNADVNIQDFVGNTALHCSARTGVLSILQVLIKSGCNINQLNLLWETPLHIAVKSNSEPVVKLLLENQANVNFRHHLGNAALYESIRRGFLNISRLLIDSGGNINKQNDNGKPPLHTAGSSTGSVKIPRTEAPVLELSAAAAPDRGLSGQQPSSDGEKKGSGTSEEDEPSGEQCLQKERKRKTSGSTFDLEHSVAAATDKGLSEEQPSSDEEETGVGANKEDGPSGEQSLQNERKRKTSGSTFDLGSFTSVMTIPRAEFSIQLQSAEAALHKGLSGQQSSCDEEKEATRTSEEEEPSREPSLEKGMNSILCSSTGSARTPTADPPVQGQSAVAAPDRVLSGQQPSSDQERKWSGANVEHGPSALQFLRKDRKRKASGSTFDLAEVRDTDVGQHEEIGNDAAPDPVPFQSNAGRHADSRFYQPPQPGPSQPSVLSDYKQVPVAVPEGFNENRPYPLHSATTNLLQQNPPEWVQISQASTGSYAPRQDSAKVYLNSAEKLHPHHNLPFSQEEKSPLEMELQVHLPSVVKPFEDPATNNEESRNTVVPENNDQPDRGSQNVSPGKQQGGVTTGARSGENPPFSCAKEKVPVERCISTDFFDAGLHCSQKRCPLEMSYDCIKSHRGVEELGRGGFGVVYEGTKMFHGQRVVVKEAYDSHCGQVYSSGQLKREKRVGYIKHPHFMPLYAYSEEKGKPCCLMYPKMASDLDKALRKDSKGKEKLCWENRVRIALHTARALKYLHTEVNSGKFVRKEIIHMDVKPGNIFLDEDLNARLGDTGMAQELPIGYSFASFSQMRGTQGYLDPYNLDAVHFRPINDIFSFGVVLLQLLTQRKVVEKTSNVNKSLHRVLMEEGVLSDPEKLMAKAKQDVWPSSEEMQNYTKEFAAIAIDCLRPNESRAKLDDICYRLEEILKSRGFAKLSKPREGARCMSCLLNHPAKHLVVNSSGCDGDHNQDCNYFCVTCLKQARRNPLECPFHGPAEPCIGGSNTYAVLVCGNDAHSQVTAAVFQRDLYGMKSVLTDSRVVGIRSDHMYCIKPQSTGSQAAEVRNTLDHLKEQLAKEGKKDVFLYFYFSGHSDQNGNLMCSSDQDVFTGTELRKSLDLLKDNVGEFLVILDCCYADGKIASEQIEDERFLVHKSLESVTAVEVPHPLPLESLFSKLDCSDECSDAPSKEPISTTVQGSETDFDTLDGSVFSKGPHILQIRQWSSSLKAQLSYGKKKGNGFLTEYIIHGLQGAHNCPFARPKCLDCETFKAKARSVGYISATNLEDFVSKHVEKAATKAGGQHQNPQMQTLHSKDRVLAYYNEKSLCDKVIFKSSSSDLESITVDHNYFPLTPERLQEQVYSKVEGKLPNGSNPKHLQTLCDGEELSPTSDVDLIEFIREGYDVQCQMRPCSSILSGPVMLEMKNYSDSITKLLNCLQLKKTQSYLGLDTFELDTNQTKYALDDIKEQWDDNSSFRNLQGTPFDDVIVLITTSSQYMGTLTICVLPEILDCSFQATT